MSNHLKSDYPGALKQRTLNYPTHLVDSKAINESYSRAFHKLNSLVECNKKEGICSKLCCICDRFIQYREEKHLPIKWLFHICVHIYFHTDTIDWGNPDIKFVSQQVKNKVLKQYTQHCIRGRVTIDGVLVNLNEFVLSPQTYGIDCSKTGKLSFFDCCSESYAAIKNEE